MPTEPPDDPPPERRPFPGSLCHQCAAIRYVGSKTSTFLMCQALPVKYPRQPVTACPAFRPKAPPSP